MGERAGRWALKMVTITEVCVLASATQHSLTSTLARTKDGDALCDEYSRKPPVLRTFIRPQWELRLADWGHPDQHSDLDTVISETVHWTLHTQGQ